jgi:phage FluMu protein Com
MSQMTQVSMWRDPVRVEKLIRDVISLRPALSSKGNLDCPQCNGTLVRARDYQGYIYIRCRRCEENDTTVAEGRA